jgi:hypothetical protein
MKYRNIIIALGFVIAILSFLGIPRSWKEIVFVALGASVIGLAYLSGLGPKASA